MQLKASLVRVGYRAGGQGDSELKDSGGKLETRGEGERHRLE